MLRDRNRQLLLALVAGSAVPMAAHATILNYASAVNGTASTPARWAPAQAPVAADDLVFNATAGAQVYSVTFDAATATSRTMSFQEDTVTLTMNSPHTTTNGVAIGDLASDLSTVTLSGGTWNSGPSGFVNIGDAGLSTGTFNVTGSTAHFAVLGTSDLFVGNNGTGTLNITSTGDVTCADLMHVGQGAAGSGNVTVSGFSAVIPFGSSQLLVNGAGESRWGNGGDATVNIANGGQVNFAGSLVIGNLSTSVANVTVGGAGFITGTTLNVDGDLSIGRNPTAALAAGTGTVTVNSDGNVQVGVTLHVGDDPDGGTGTLNINSGALVVASGIVDGSNGTINHSGGTLRLNAGTYAGADPIVVTGTGSPTLHLTGTFNQTMAPAGAVALIVGDDIGIGTFTGNLLIDGGADLNVGSADINIGDDSGTTGDVTVTGAGSTLVANGVNSDIRVGFNGEGNLSIESGGSCNFKNLLVPGIDGGDGFVNVMGTGSTLTTQFLAIDHTLGTGAGFVQSQLGSTISVTDPGFSTNVRAGGVLLVGVNSTFTTPGTITVDAAARLDIDGTITNATLVDFNGGLLRSGLTDNALVDAPVRVRSGGAVEAVFGDLTMGDAVSTSGVILDSGSTVTVGSGKTLTLLDNGGSALNGRIDMQGGTIASSDSLLKDATAASDQLVGFGTIDADIRLETSPGACNPSGTGLVFTRDVLMNGAFNVTGTTFRLASTAKMVNLTPSSPDFFNCKFVADAGSVIEPNIGNTGTLGTITMGDATTTAVTLSGILHMGTNSSFTFDDPDGVNIDNLIDMNGGLLACPSGGFTVNTSGIVRGHGTIDVGTAGGDQFILFSGGIDPDAYDATSDTYHGVATFSIDGTYIQNPNSEYYCEIAGFNNEFQPLNDRLDVGAATLAGTLDVSLIDGYVPQQCHEFTIMNYTSRSGTWTNIIQPPGASVGIRYEATRAVLFFNSVGCDDIDYNNDGLFPDTADIDDFLSVFSGGPCSTGTCSDIDFNNDCLFPDTTDIDTLLTVFSGGPCI